MELRSNLKLSLNKTRQQREFKLSQLNQLATLQQKLAQFFELKIESQQLNDRLKRCSEQFQQLEKTTIQAEQDFQTAKQARLKLQEVLQQQRLLHAENVEHLRAELIDGQPCVVCGSTTHPYHLDDSAISKVLFELQQQQEQQATLKEQQTFNLWQAAQQNLTKLSVEQQQLKTTLQNVTEKITVIQQLCIEQGQSAQIPLNVTHTQSEIKQQLEQLTQQYQFDIQQLEAQSKQWIQSIKIQQQLSQSIQHTEHLLQNANNLHNQVQHIVSCLADREKNAWQQYSITTAQYILSQLNTRTQQLEQLELLSKQHDQYLQQLNTTQLNIANTAKHISETAHSLNEIKLKGQQNTELANQLIQNMTGLTEVKPNEWLTQYDHEYQKIQTLYQQQKQSFNQLRNQFEQEKSQLEQLNAQQQHNQNNLNLVNQDIQQWLTQHPAFQPDDLELLAQITAVQEQQIRQQLQHAERMLNEANSALNTIQEQLTEHTLHQPEIDFEQLQQLILNNANTLKTQFEIRDQLKLKLELHQQNVAKQKQFADQIQQVQQEEHRWGKISDLMGDATGKKFRDYAQQYNLDILLEHANQQLAMLSQTLYLKTIR